MADRLKAGLAILAFIAGLVGFYLLGDQPTVVRVASVLVGLLVGLGIAYTSEPGRRFMAYARDSYHEVRRVVWPSRKETFQMTGIVFAFVVLMAIFLWLADKLIEWILYGLLLGWN